MVDSECDSFGKCILKLDCLENFNTNEYNEDNELGEARGFATGKKKYFSSSDESDATEDSVSTLSNPGLNSNESSDSAIGSLDSGPEEVDTLKQPICADRYGSSESSERFSMDIKSEYEVSHLAKVFKNSIFQSAEDECDDFDGENVVCEDDCFVDSACSSEGCGENNDIFWHADLKRICNQKNHADSCSNSSRILNDNCSSSCPSSSSSICNDTGFTSECSKASNTKNGLPDTNSGHCVVNSVSGCEENIRFPSNKNKSYPSERLCRWSECIDLISSSSKLLEHLQTEHVNSQILSETFMCSWIGCKVFGKPSCSRTWLERHVLTHVGNKPYKCIVDNCGQRFSSQAVLERHVNQHFKIPKYYADGVTETATKSIRRNGRKLHYRRQRYSVRSRSDVFDAGIMPQLQYSLVQMAHRCKNVSLNILDSENFLHITFQSKVIGCRQETNGSVKYLIRWHPINALEDEWLPKSEIENTRNIPIWKLPASVQQLFWDSVFPNQRSNVRPSRKNTADSSDSR